jgi:hypothetical protein
MCARLIERLEGMLEGGDVEGMLVTTFRELVEMPPKEIELLRSQRDAWRCGWEMPPACPAK